MKCHLLGLLFGIITFMIGLGVSKLENQSVYTFKVQSDIAYAKFRSVSEFEIGKLEALQDVQQGKRTYRRCERNCIWTELTDEFEDIMINQYGIKVEAIDSCSVSGPSRERTEGYNLEIRLSFSETCQKLG